MWPWLQLVPKSFANLFLSFGISLFIIYLQETITLENVYKELILNDKAI